MPFYYSALFDVWSYFEVEEEVARKYLDDDTLEIYTINGKAISSFNFQTYAAQMPDNEMDSWTAELELSFLTYPKASAEIVPNVSLEEYLRGDDSSRLIGNYRVKVPADNSIAILAGKAAFGEPKFPALFTSNIPSLNPYEAAKKVDFNTWQFSIFAPEGAENMPAPPWTKGEQLINCKIDLMRRSGVPTNPSPVSYYGQDMPQFDVNVGEPVNPELYFEIPTHDPSRKSIGARWNLLMTPTLYTPGDDPFSIEIEYGNSDYEGLVSAFKDLISFPCVAVQTFFPEPAAIESGAYYL